MGDFFFRILAAQQHKFVSRWTHTYKICIAMQICLKIIWHASSILPKHVNNPPVCMPISPPDSPPICKLSTDVPTDQSTRQPTDLQAQYRRANRSVHLVSTPLGLFSKCKQFIQSHCFAKV